MTRRAPTAAVNTAAPGPRRVPGLAPGIAAPVVSRVAAGLARAAPPLALALAALALFGPTLRDLHRLVWQADPTSQGPMALVLALGLYVHRWRQPAAQAVLATAQPQPALGLAWLLPGLALHVIGRSQGLIAAEVLAGAVCAVGLIVLFRGARMARVLGFCHVFLLFSVPLPGVLVEALTHPLKIGVSWLAEQALYAGGLPVAREGVVLHVGAYRLLVADACSGLQSLFTLEAFGLLYLNLVRHPSALRNLLMALAIVPIAFAANTLRVIVLALVTRYGGDAAGRGLAHDFSGLLLFGLAFLLVVATDFVARRVARGAGR